MDCEGGMKDQASTERRVLVGDGGVKSSRGSRYLGRIKVFGMRHEPMSKQKFKSPSIHLRCLVNG